MGRCSDAKDRLMDAVSQLIFTGSYGSTTIDQICERAGVKKGSFYYFFESKADLALVAIDKECARWRPQLDAIFSPTVPPLERLTKYWEQACAFQAEIKAKYGRVLGCALFSLGSEVSTQESRLQKKIQEILDQKQKYLESAIRDAHAAGLVNAPDAASKARALFSYYEGLLTQARIRNDLGVLNEGFRGTHDLLGVSHAEAVIA